MTVASNFRIEFEGGRPAGDLMQFMPGDTLVGRVVFTAERDVTVHSLKTVIRWTAEGKGDTDEMVDPLHHDTMPLDEMTRQLTVGQSLTRAFRVTLPAEPWSYTGKIVSIVWAVTATLDVPWARDPSISKRFLLRP